MMTLDELCVKHNCDKGLLPGGIGHGYCDSYASVLEPLRDKPIRLLEIGVGDGKSIRVWLDYFSHRDFQLIGVDIDPVIKSYDRFTFVQGDQTNPSFWSDDFRHVNPWGMDVVIDDGSHMSDGITISFEALWPFVKSGGYYIIEDLRTSYLSGYQVTGWPPPMTFIKQLLDDINAQTDYKPAPHLEFNYPKGTDGGRGIEWMRFSEELCILKKK